MRPERERIYSYLRTYAAPPDGPDANLLLRIAQRRFRGDRDDEPTLKLPYIRFLMPSSGGKPGCVFLLNAPEPAMCQPWLDIFYIGLNEGYARAIRIMCLRFAADRQILRGMCACDKSFTFPAPLTQTPHGAETLWHERGRDASSSRGSRLYPEWFDKALESLCKCRRTLFAGAYIAALSFVVEHELQHGLDWLAKGNEKKPTKQLELDADRGALTRLFQFEVNRPGINAAICGVLATFVVFHLKLVLDDLEGIDQKKIDWYPSVRERTRQFAKVLINTGVHANSLLPAFALLRHLVEVSSLHPAYACVIGIPWIAE